MHLRKPHFERPDSSAVFAVVALVIVGLAGCATELTPSPGNSAAPYVGVFTGEYVDGKPLYRLPTIEVVGLRSSIIER